ncbi:MAG: sensor histidine kinase [Clostridia bacterium]|nr:sensor histidine kinase [Clostridia bacterium]
MMKYLKSIRVQLVMIVLLCYLVPTLLLGQYMGGALFDELRTKTETALTSSVEHAYTLGLQHIQRAIELAKGATYDGELTQVYAGYQAGSTSAAEFLRQSRNYIERKYSREELFSFALYFPVDDPDMLIYNRAGYEAAMAYQRSAAQHIAELGETLDTKCLFLEAEGQLYLVRNLMNLKMERFGMLVLGVNQDKLFAEVRSLAQTWDGDVQLMLGQAGNSDAAWDEWPQGLYETDENKLVYVRRDKDRDYDFGLRLSVNQERIYGEVYAFRRLMTGLFALLVPILTLILLYARQRIVRPISLLSQASQRIEEGELGVTVPMHGDDELGRLGRAFSKMSRRIQELIDKTYKEEIALRDAKIQAMQSRINPHFINNALETLNWQARMEGSEAMSGMVESLSVLLNAGMGRANRRMVSMSEEIDVARAYCYFVGLRFGEKLQVEYHFDDSVMGAVVPLLTLQPLLENAVEHGIEPAGGGMIELHSLRAGDCLRLQVINSGKSLSEEDWQRIRASLSGDNQGGHHLGLANISTRLQLIYGGRADIRVETDDLGRTVVQLDIPLNGEENA